MAPYGVVIVDRWPIVRVGIGRLLPSLKYRILEEADGAASARRAVQRRHPDLVILGSHLVDSPVGVVKMAKGENCRILVLVDQADRTHIAALARGGADGILSGSTSPEELTAAVGRVMKGERALSPDLVPALAGISLPGPAGSADPTPMLTPREREVLECLVRGARNDEIAGQLFLSPATVKSHLSSIYSKLEVRGRHEATARAVQLGLAQP